MCGIIGYLGNKNSAGEIVFQALKKLEYRGYDSWGIAFKPLKAKKISVSKNIGKISKAFFPSQSANLALGHTRWATHGKVSVRNAHPHLDCKGKLAVVHNGIVENFQKLKIELQKKRHHFLSETDSEVIIHLIEENLKKNNFEKAVFSAFARLVGNNAIVVLNSDEEKIIAVRNGSPLVVGIAENEAFLASDAIVFLKYTKKAVFLDDNQAVIVSRKKLNFYDLCKKTFFKPKITKLNWREEEAKKGGYPYFLIKEIFEQKKTISQTAALNSKNILLLQKKIKQSKNIFLTGCGTAAYCAMAGQYFFAEAGIKSQAIGAYEILPFIKFLDKNSILFAISQSGETADTLIAVKEAKKQKAKIISIINAPGSSLERLSDFTLKVNAGPEIAVVSTKAFTSQLAVLYLLAQAVKGSYSEAQKKIKNIKEILSLWLTKKHILPIIKTAKKLAKTNNIYLIGKHLNYIAALEFALKIKEASYIHSEAFSSAELKHGVISLVKKGTVCFVLNDRSHTKAEVLSSALEMKCRGATIYGFAPDNDKAYDFFIKTPFLNDLTFLGNIIAGQLLAYYLSIERGADPDKPRNLAKSVTVK